MLRGTVAFLALVAFALLGAELRTALARRGLRAPAMEGLSFLAIGFALGDRVLGLFPADVLETLRVVVLLGLAWIGLVFGLQIELRVLAHLSKDPAFATKLRDIVGLYVDPPAHAVVLSVDEKSQIQALDRTQPGLPMKRGRCGTYTHDYKRNGTTTLFAALNTLTGEVLGTCAQRHRHQEWLVFLRKINQSTPKDKDIHIICDNYATHKHPKVKSWLKYHKRFHVHFTPTSASWLNMVERFFRELTEKQLRRGVYASVEELEGSVMAFIETHNKAPAPYIWTKSASDILEKVKRGREKLDKLQTV